MTDQSMEQRGIEMFSSGIVTTGITGLDTLLGGGIPSGSLLLIVGAPGTGKTLLTQQLCFHIASQDARAIYFSTLSEPHGKLVRQLQPFGFFDPAMLGDRVTLLALQDFLRQGLEATADVVVRTARQQHASFVCVDGFRAIEAVGGSDLAARQFLYQLSSQLHLLGVTSVVTLERDADDRDEYGAMTVADGVLLCHYDVVGVRHRRKVEVRKLRTMAHLHGLHTYRIDTSGWTIFPRFEELVPVETTEFRTARWEERLGFGIAGLDRLLDQGVTPGSTTMIIGEPGAGKTLLTLYWVHEGLRRGEPALFIGFDEQRDQLLEKARKFGIALDKYLQSGQLSIRTFAPVENEPDEIAVVLREAIERMSVRRLVIDGVFYLERPTQREERGHDFFGALATYLNKAGVALCATKTINRLGVEQVDVRDTPLSFMAENLLWLRQTRNDGHIYRTLSVLALRGGNPDQGVYEYAIESSGLVIRRRFGDENVKGAEA
jgi:circadian clock protein KaiC